MFNFLGMMGNYDNRKIGRFDDNGIIISTALVTDGDFKYETAVGHPDYDAGDFIIVEAYSNRDNAESGHEKWVGIMTSDELPNELRDCQNSSVSQLVPSDDLIYPRIINLKFNDPKAIDAPKED